LDRDSGEILWKAATLNGIDCSPAVANGTLFVGSLDFFFYAIDTSSGAIRWKYEAELGISSSPAVSGDIVVFGCKGGVLRALNTQTGKLLWSQFLGQAITAAPVISGSTVWIQSGVTHALDLADGKVRWWAPARIFNAVGSRSYGAGGLPDQYGRRCLCAGLGPFWRARAWPFWRSHRPSLLPRAERSFITSATPWVRSLKSSSTTTIWSRPPPPRARLSMKLSASTAS
jgi:glucose dehydrogenase